MRPKNKHNFPFCYLYLHQTTNNVYLFPRARRWATELSDDLDMFEEKHHGVYLGFKGLRRLTNLGAWRGGCVERARRRPCDALAGLRRLTDLGAGCCVVPC